MSVFDGDTSSRSEPDPEVLRDAISHDEEEITIKAGAWRRGDELITFRPVEYDARFSQLAGAKNESACRCPTAEWSAPRYGGR